MEDALVGDDRLWYSEMCDVFYCRKCRPKGKGYSVYDFVMRHQGITEAKAEEQVAAVSGFGEAKPTLPTRQQRKKSSTPKSQTTYAVSTSDVAVSVSELLKKQVSLYPRCTTNTPSGTTSIGEVLQTFQVGGKFIPNGCRNGTDSSCNSCPTE